MASERDARAKILDAARDLFSEKGYRGTSVREIASRAQVNLAMIHYYFGNKEGLYRSLLETEVGRVREIAAVAASLDGTVSSKIESFVHDYARWLCSNPNFARLAQQELLSGGKHFQEVFRPQAGRNYATLRQLLKEGVDSGEFRDIDVDLAPLSLIGMIAFIFVARPVVAGLLGVDPGSDLFADRLAKHSANLFLKGIRHE